ncbi:hypothetical protein KY389_09800 [Paracoccus bogoriensis]|uniref:hypothetical protein n=1 Tax=Paracoccus bogoriensis TaxID=242065 RepID=UPI001CA5923E|nr:hypothetical protein [Paracoccus bogoriensis]MBW7056985.1 hypothetical protein [Paracoccus bogoriensis]
MPHFIPDATYARLLDGLTGAFMTAATSPTTDLRDTLAEALADADLLPEVCRGDFAGEVRTA